MSSIPKKLSWRVIFWAFQVPLFILIVLGILPRSVVPFFAGVLVLYVILAPLEDAVLFFVASIQLFIAIPITATWDNFNTWRILSIIIFLKWIFGKGNFQFLILNFKLLYASPVRWCREHQVAATLLGLFALTGLSLIGTTDLRAGITRIIYFINLSLIGIVVCDSVSCQLLSVKRLLRSVMVATVLVVAVGYVQVVSTYLMDVYAFMRIWGEGIQLNQFGTVWSTIAVRMGNTWLAYYGPQLSLRVFSLFPDSHSFPVFVLLGIPALFAFGIRRIVESGKTSSSTSLQDPSRSSTYQNSTPPRSSFRASYMKFFAGLHRKYADGALWSMLNTYANMSVLWIPAAFLIVILSGTRGIWAASVPVVGLAVVLVLWFRRIRAEHGRKNLFTYIALYLVIFFMLFAVAYPIFVSPQFLLAKGDWALLGNRIRSIVDFGETSNAARIEIWTKTLQSMARHPLLGVGIGNFPVVLSQNVFLAKAGSSAHNIYLHIAGELGIPALLLALWFFWLLFARIYKNFLAETEAVLSSYWGALLLFYPWVLAYLMTDAALFDERAFLLFAVTAGIVFGKTR